eukprot:TRINITY_DN6376_c0_g1_i2.p1 TRINITY_DN6376_c0_g1~~TRINITY_DN6376_c0_g1_i2.p1  ORF type:complete len:238 (-),score=78.40 TRINITY_DN6376_c0_g1_i2:175-888(-)
MTTLVKYDNPVAVSEAQGKARALGRRNGAKLPPVESRLPPQSPEDILNTIIPPREWVEGGQPWVQFVSSHPATRLDVIHLQEQLDQRLAQRQARDLGICPVREELYAQCFDEIIRQVTVNCAERGLLLLRIRDEVRQTVGAYRTLYESSVAFGMRKALTAEQGRADTLATVRQLEREREALRAQVAALEAKCEALDREETEHRQVEDKKHQEEVAFLRKANQQLTSQLQAILGTSKK